jgi:hypothetical protein
MADVGSFGKYSSSLRPCANLLLVCNCDGGMSLLCPMGKRRDPFPCSSCATIHYRPQALLGIAVQSLHGEIQYISRPMPIVFGDFLWSTAATSAEIVQAPLYPTLDRRRQRPRQHARKHAHAWPRSKPSRSSSRLAWGIPHQRPLSEGQWHI